MKYRVEQGGNVHEVDVEVRTDGYLVRGPDGQQQLIRFETRADGSQRALTPWGELEVQSVRRDTELWAQVSGRRLLAEVERLRPTGALSVAGASVGSVCAPMAGRLLRVEVKPGDAVRSGQALAVIEAMKMENELISPVAGVVTQVLFEPPTTVDKGALIVKVEPA